MKKTMQKENKKQKPCSRVYAGSWTVTLLGLLLVLTSFVGCVRSKKNVIHPLSEDFKLVDQGENFTATKSGAFVSDYFLSNVMEVEVEV